MKRGLSARRPSTSFELFLTREHLAELFPTRPYDAVARIPIEDTYEPAIGVALPRSPKEDPDRERRRG